MDKKTVFVKTDKGEGEVSGRSDALFGDVKRILLLVDDESTVAEITKRAPPSLRDALQNLLQELDDGGYIRDMRAPVNVPEKPVLKMSTPAFKMATPKAPPPQAPVPPPVVQRPVTPPSAIPSAPSKAAPVAAKPSMSMPDMMMPTMSQPAPVKEEPTKPNNKSELDFSFLTGGGGSSSSVDQAAKDKAAKDKVLADALQKSMQEAAQQAALQEAATKAAKLKAYEEAKVRAKIEVEAKAKFEAEAKARIEAETRAKSAAEAARLKAEQEAQKTRAELEAAKAKMEAEMRARIEVEARAKQEIDNARIKAEKEAEKIRLELEAVKAKADAEIRSRLEAEARVKAETEARLKREAEAAKLKVEKERAELEAVRIKAEAEVKSRLEAEARIKAEVEARMQQEAAAEKLRLEKVQAELDAAKAKAEVEVKYRLEAEARIKAEVDAEIKAKADAEARIRAEVEARLKAEELAKSSAAKTPPASLVTSAPPVKEEPADPGEKLRQSFVESFGQKTKPAQNPAATGSFKLASFSLLDTGKMPAASAPQATPKAEVPGTGGSKVKAVLEQRAQKEAEEKRLKAEQEAARVKAQQDEAARIKAEKDAVRFAAEREAYRKQAEEDEARAKAEAEAQKLSSQQSKQWEDAQQRAAIHAQAEQERLARQSIDTQSQSKQKTSRGPRKSLPVGKILAGLFVLALAAVAGLPYVLPMNEYIAPLEQEISSQINQPVKINNIHVAILPLPRLDIDMLVLGSGKEITVKSVIVNFDYSALFASTKLINKLELNDVNVAGTALDKVVDWTRMVGGSEKYPVSRMEMHGVRVNTSEVKLPVLHGKVDFDPLGKFVKAELKSEDEKLSFELEPLQNRLQLGVNIRDSSLPVLSALKFNDLSATGVIENGEFIISDIFAHIYGGTLTGKGKLGWFNGWKLDVLMKAKSFELQSLFPSYGITGQVFGDANISMFAPQLSLLDKDPRLEGSFEAKDGVINKLDIDTIARFGSRQGGGARTTYTEINGTVKSDNRGQRFYLSKIAAGSVSGSGLFEVDGNQQLTGRLLVDVKGGTRGAVTMQLSGTPMEPALQLGR